MLHLALEQLQRDTRSRRTVFVVIPPTKFSDVGMARNSAVSLTILDSIGKRIK